MDLQTLIQHIAENKVLTQLAKFFAAALAGIIAEISLMKLQGKELTWPLALVMLVGGGATACAVGYLLKDSNAPEYVIYTGCYLSGMSGLSLMQWIHMKISKRNFGETLRQIIELLFKK